MKHSRPQMFLDIMHTLTSLVYTSCVRRPCGKAPEHSSRDAVGVGVLCASSLTETL